MNITPLLQKLYPQGSIGPGPGAYQGQCVEFCHAIADFGTMGNSYRQKKAFVDANGITAPNIQEVAKGFRIGDVVVTSDGTFWGFGAGHAFIVADQDANYLYAAESNFGLKIRVTYGRKVAKNDSKIYGIVRTPLKIQLPSVEIKVSLFMNFPKQWDIKIADDAIAKFNQMTGGRITINPFGLYTSLKDWPYEYSPNPFTGEMVKTMSKSYFEQEVLPLQFYSNATVFCVSPQEYDGKVGNAQELAWYFPNSNPAEIIISSNETDVSPWYSGMPLYQHALIHELSHWLHFINGTCDTTHITDNQNHQLDQLFTDVDFNRVIANI